MRESEVEQEREMPRGATRGWSRWYPYVLAGLSVPCVYFSILTIYGQRMFAAVAATIVCLALLILLRLWQSRGKLSLAITTFALPLLAAVVCIGTMKLLPLAERQRTIRELTRADIRFTRQTAMINGEWVHDRSGIMLPLWFAERIGPDCLTEVRSINTSLEKLQGFGYRKIPTGSLNEIHLLREGKGPEITEDFVRWLNTCEQARLHLDLKYVTPADVAAISRLSPDLLYHSVFSFEDEILELDLPGSSLSLTVMGESISASAARRLLKAKEHNPYARVFVGVPTIEPDAIDAIGVRSPLWLGLSGTALDAGDVEALTRHDFKHLSFLKVSLPPANVLRQLANDVSSGFVDGSERISGNLGIVESQVTLEQIIEFANCLRHTHLETDLLLSPDQLEELWRSTTLDSLTCSIQGENGSYYRVKRARDGREDFRSPAYYVPRNTATGKPIDPGEDWRGEEE